jgi:hypothetical protein
MLGVFIPAASLYRPRLARPWLLKTNRFLRGLGLSPMQSVPDYCAEQAEDISECRGYDEERSGRRRIE